MKQKFNSESLRPFINMDGLKGTEIVQRKQYVGDISIKPEEDRTIVARISTRSVDADNEIVMPDGADLKRFAMNPVIHQNHSYLVEDVIGKATEIGTDENGIVAKIKFANTPRAEDAWQLVKGGFVRAHSIGFIAKEIFVKGTKEFAEYVKAKGIEVSDSCKTIISKFELLESSLVSLPCNPDALNTAISEKRISLTEKTIKELDLPKVIIIKEGYGCQCLSCGYKVESETHCNEIICPKCGGKMRRAERPGIGKEGKELIKEDENMKVKVEGEANVGSEVTTEEVGANVGSEVTMEGMLGEAELEPEVTAELVKAEGDANVSSEVVTEEVGANVGAEASSITVLRYGGIDYKAIADLRLKVRRGKIL